MEQLWGRRNDLGAQSSQVKMNSLLRRNVSMQHLMRRDCLKLWTFLLVAIAPAPPAPAAPGNEIPVVDPFFMLSGALLKDSFDGPQLDASLWSRPLWLVENHKTIGVTIENGHLVISGSSQPERQHHQYAGIISKYFRDTDVVLAAEVQIQSLFESKGRIQHMVHLCSGDYPDFFTEIIFGKIAATEAPRWHSAYLARVWEYSGYGEYVDPTRAATGSEATQWHTVVLTHDGTTSEEPELPCGEWTMDTGWPSPFGAFQPHAHRTQSRCECYERTDPNGCGQREAISEPGAQSRYDCRLHRCEREQAEIAHSQPKGPNLRRRLDALAGRGFDRRGRRGANFAEDRCAISGRGGNCGIGRHGTRCPGQDPAPRG
jgi:hypothetical protein